MIFSSVIVMSAVLLLLSSYIKTEAIRNSLILIAIICYAILIALKGGSGSDGLGYTVLYNHILVPDAYYFLEPGLKFLFVFLQFNGAEYYVVNIIQSVTVAASLYLIAVKKSPLMVVLYISYIGLNVDFSTLRQSLSLHLFVIAIYAFRSQLVAVFISGLFHLSSVVSYLVNIVESKLTLKAISLLVIILSIVSYIYLERYLTKGSMFIFRDDIFFLAQSIMIVGILYMMNVSKKILFAIFLISFIPIGFRIVFYFLILSESSLPKKTLNKGILSFALFSLLLVKLNSFVNQSLFNDGSRSVIYFFDELYRSI